MSYSVWPPRLVDELESKLSDLQQTASQADLVREHPEASSWLARLLVVRSSGYLEQTVAAVCREYVNGKSGGLVRAFAQSWLERTPNPTPENLESLVGRFDLTVLSRFTAFLDADDERLRRELAFMVDRRNKIAHGHNEGIGLRKATDLQSVATEVAEWFIIEFNPNPGIK